MKAHSRAGKHPGEDISPVRTSRPPSTPPRPAPPRPTFNLELAVHKMQHARCSAQDEALWTLRRPQLWPALHCLDSLTEPCGRAWLMSDAGTATRNICSIGMRSSPSSPCGQGCEHLRNQSTTPACCGSARLGDDGAMALACVRTSMRAGEGARVQGCQ